MGDYIGIAASIAATNRMWGISNSTSFVTDNGRFVRVFNGVEGIANGYYSMASEIARDSLSQQMFDAATSGIGGIWGIGAFAGVADGLYDYSQYGNPLHAGIMGLDSAAKAVISGYIGTLTTVGLICLTTTPVGAAIFVGIGVSIATAYILNKVDERFITPPIDKAFGY